MAQKSAYAIPVSLTPITAFPRNTRLHQAMPMVDRRPLAQSTTRPRINVRTASLPAYMLFLRLPVADIRSPHVTHSQVDVSAITMLHTLRTSGHRLCQIPLTASNRSNNVQPRDRVP